jgi:hypothetical protein
VETHDCIGTPESARHSIQVVAWPRVAQQKVPELRVVRWEALGAR